jgi:hypothetical protein
MTNLKVLCKALVLLACFCFYSSFTLADTSAPTNPTTTSPDTLDLSDGTITNPQYGCPSGTTAAHVNTSNWGTETVRFGECVNTFAITYAINQALTGTGVSIDKVHYSWRYVMCFQTPSDSCNTNLSNRVNTTTGEVTDDTYFDELQVVIEITDTNGNVVETKTWNMDTWYQWNATNSHSDNEVTVGSVRWQIEEGNIEIYNHIDKTGTIRTPNAVGDVRFRINGQDKGNWDGYYGPVVNRLQTWFTYRANPCNDTALYDPSCPGYATAYATWQYDQNCSADATYDSGCPGYATAYYNQQCSADPLYDSGCDGYAEAYYSQQCGISALYDSGCTGYAEAYYTQQCTANALYDSGCNGYEAAYLSQQCGISALYSIACDGYASAYYDQQCGISALYDSGCDGYAAAYLTQQCDADATYDIRCTGYEQAYFDQQCLYNPQYDPLCTGYVAPVVEASPEDLIDDGAGTGDSIVDSVIEVPTLPVINLIPDIPETIEVPQPEIVMPTVPEVEVVVVEVPTAVEQIELEVEAQIEQELEIETLPEVEVETVESEPQNETQDSEEESGSDVEQSMDSDGTDEDSSDSGSSEEDSSTEDTEGDTEEAVEESTEDESTEDETTEEESTEEESTEEESTEEESSEEESTEEEATEEEATEEKPVVKKKNIKKLTKAQKEKAKREKMKEIIKDKLKKLADDMGKAQTLEAQQALQQIIAALINYVPGFNAYGELAIPGVDFYQSDEIYKDKKVPENLRGLRNGLASELLHKKMVDMQYEGMD